MGRLEIQKKKYEVENFEEIHYIGDLGIRGRIMLK
jgi:hypothetical protein